MVIITEENFYKFALHSLKSKYISESEFKSLLKHITYIKRLLKKYKDSPRNINVNLLVNHFIIIFNEFELSSANQILLYQINSLYYPQLKTILLMLNKIRESDCFEINYQRIEIKEVLIDKVLEKTLKTII